ncbi:isoprenyl transferase [Bhargavaea beijingensis]|uniref:Isoprenyl transferase n=1 Tax=Bhargavaea beijingensis TaxID=426756 RepID=A0A1G7CCN9_9BACL|nr:isoprenyl transferase [Bhargavaea beijingensis]MCW1926934.1 isoprenyl transferase [Bhargavaea beijingensis]RSK36823.1 isoprenyl transferase [Bhargavaea beijingensis]SDE37097.1 undecaprenyl diphosphate synthase [Bhargavaea beijingensis]
MLDKLIRKKGGESKVENGERPELDKTMIPRHVAIIMDGNGRWAKKRSLPRIAGHHEGMKTVRKITREADRLGIKVLTLYAFSTENWKRPKPEVEFLMRLPEEFLGTYLPELVERNVCVRMMGDHAHLPMHTRRAITKAMEATAENDGLILNFAMNYGSRAEITEAVRSIARAVAENRMSAEDINESLITGALMTAELPEPDLLIRTSGEVRLSNFMLWQLAYTEFWFTETLWPDFDESRLQEAIAVYQARNRRYGGVDKEDTE